MGEPVGSACVATIGADDETVAAARDAVGESGVVVACESAEEVASRAPGAVSVIVGGTATGNGVTAELSELVPKAELLVVPADATGRERSLIGRLAAAQLRTALARSAADDFASLMAHEVRGYLSTLSLAGDVLSMKLAGTDAIQQIQAMGRAVAGAGSCISDLRELVRVEREGLQLSRSEVDARLLTEEAVAAIPELGMRSRCEVTARLPDARVAASLDGDRIGQALRELLALVLRHVPSGNAVLSLNEQGDELVWTLEVDAAKLAPARPMDLFERTWRGPSGAGALEKGAALTRWIAAEHGGRVGVERSGESLRIELRLARQPTCPAER